MNMKPETTKMLSELITQVKSEIDELNTKMVEHEFNHPTRNDLVKEICDLESFKTYAITLMLNCRAARTKYGIRASGEKVCSQCIHLVIGQDSFGATFRCPNYENHIHEPDASYCSKFRQDTGE